MAKSSRPSLDTLRRPKPGAAPAPGAADGDLADGGPRPPSGRAGADATPRDERAMTLRLSKELMRSLKLAAINEERPASEIIRDAIRAYLRNAGGARP